MTWQGNRWQCPSLTSVVAKFSNEEKFSLIWNHGHISVIAWCSKLKKFNTARSIRRRDWCWKIVASHRTHLTLCGCNWCASQLHISLHLYMDFPLGQCRNATPYLAECTFGYQTLILGIYLLALGAFGSWQFSVNLLARSMVICLKSVWNWILTWYCFAIIWITILVNLMISICKCDQCPRWLYRVIITGGASAHLPAAAYGLPLSNAKCKNKNWRIWKYKNTNEKSNNHSHLPLF